MMWIPRIQTRLWSVSVRVSTALSGAGSEMLMSALLLVQTWTRIAGGHLLCQ